MLPHSAFPFKGQDDAARPTCYHPRMTGTDFDAEAIALLKTADPDTQLRLKDAARIGFPVGGMTATALRGEAQRGRLLIWRIAGKDFTSLAEIRKMLERCRVEPNPAYRVDGRELRRPTVDEDKIALEHALAVVRRLKTSSPAEPRTRMRSHGPDATARRR